MLHTTRTLSSILFGRRFHLLSERFVWWKDKKMLKFFYCFCCIRYGALRSLKYEGFNCDVMVEWWNFLENCVETVGAPDCHLNLRSQTICSLWVDFSGWFSMTCLTEVYGNMSMNTLEYVGQICSREELRTTYTKEYRKQYWHYSVLALRSWIGNRSKLLW